MASGTLRDGLLLEKAIKFLLKVCLCFVLFDYNHGSFETLSAKDCCDFCLHKFKQMTLNQHDHNYFLYHGEPSINLMLGL